MCILALADDMTGALEVGAKFSGAGIGAVVSSRAIAMGSTPVLVLDTETRHVDPETAKRELTRFVSAAEAKQPRLIYKKTDSTLRGNIQAEIAALAALFPDCCIGYAPAYPALGRTVVDGVLYVHGVAVSETEFARDALNPVRSSSVSALFDPDLDCSVFDGETDDHLLESARSIVAHPRMRIAAGPSGLAEMLALTLGMKRSAAPALPGVRTCLILNGSRHPHAAIQVNKIQGKGWAPLSFSHGECDQPLQVAAGNAKALVRQVALCDPDGVLVIGGDTAFAFVRELGHPPLIPIREVVPGVPVTTVAGKHLRSVFPGRERDLILTTKAGGFGQEDVLVRVHEKLGSW